MMNQDEQPLQTVATDSVNPEEQGDGDTERLAAAPFGIQPLLLPLPPTGSAFFAQAWIRQVIASLLWGPLAQVWVAVAGAIDGESDILLSDGKLALLLLLAAGKLSSIADLPGGLLPPSVDRAGLLPQPRGEHSEGEKS